MKFIDPKNNDALERLLKNSQADFAFDQKGLKNRLMTEIEEHQLSQAEIKLRRHLNGSFLQRHRWAALTASLVLIVLCSGAAVANTNLTKPGDALHPVDQFQEELLLKLPLPVTKKAQIRADIVDERNKELEFFMQDDSQKEIRTEAVKNSVQSLGQAVETVKARQEEFENTGRTEQAEKMNQVIIRLEQLAQDQEEKVESMKEKEENEEVKKELDKQIEAIKKARERANSQNPGQGNSQK